MAHAHGLAGLLFDKDGTLLDFSGTWERAAPAILARIGDGDPARIARAAAAIGFDLSSGRFRPGAPFIAGSTSDYGPAVAEAIGRPFNDKLAEWLDRVCGEEGLRTLSPIGDLDQLFTTFRASGIALGIATNASEAEAVAQMTALGLTQHLGYVAGYDSGHGAKPRPGMVHAFARWLDVPPRRIAMIGDSTHDLTAGRAAGAVTIAVLTGLTEPRDLAPLADHMLPSIRELPELLAQLSSSS